MSTSTAKLRLLSDATYRRTSYLLKRLEDQVRVLLDEALRDYDVTAGQYLTLCLVSREGGLSSAELARRTSVTPQSMNEMIAALETKGYIRRTEDRGNRRVLQVALTREGRRLLSASERAVDRAEAAYFGRLKPAKLAELRATIEVLLGR